MLRKNQSGFGAIEAILIVVIVGIIGGAGWYVWKSQSEANNTLGNLSSAQNDPQKAEKKAVPTVDPTKDWVVFKSDAGKFSLKYPSSWVVADRLDLCTEGSLLLGGDKNSVGRCASEDSGQIGIRSILGDYRSNYDLSSGYTGIQSKEITVGSVKGFRYSGAASGQQDGEGIPGHKNGTKVISYTFYSQGRTYNATYVQKDSYPDVLKDFDLMVARTLQLN